MEPAASGASRATKTAGVVFLYVPVRACKSVQQKRVSPPSASDPSVTAAAILTICLFCTPVSEGWLAFGEGTAIYPVISLSSENGHLRVSESARDGGGKEKAFNKGNDSLEIKNKNKGLIQKRGECTKSLQSLGLIQTLPRLRRTQSCSHVIAVQGALQKLLGVTNSVPS